MLPEDNTMKTKIILLFFSLFLFSCTKDFFVGKWEQTAQSVNGDMEKIYFRNILEINEDGTWKAYLLDKNNKIFENIKYGEWERKDQKTIWLGEKTYYKISDFKENEILNTMKIEGVIFIDYYQKIE